MTPNIASRIGRNLHRQTHHPLAIILSIIQDYWHDFTLHDNLSPIVSLQANFDSLLIPPNHISRSPSDTYYINNSQCLRTHTSAHQVELLQRGERQFLVAGDVYRRDEIDKSHYPVFHQVEGVKVFPQNNVEVVTEDLKMSLEGMTQTLFGRDIKMRWVDAYFPFTNPSFELEIYFRDEWLEVLGCGVMEAAIVQHSDGVGWAFGLGLERLAMVLFDIPDIRLFWSQDERFLRQFQSGKIVKFQPYSKYPPCYKDISFWTADDFHSNDLNEIVRDVAGDLVEQVSLIDSFRHPKTNRLSHCYRIAYRSMDRSLTNSEIDSLQEQVRLLATKRLGLELR